MFKVVAFLNEDPHGYEVADLYLVEVGLGETELDATEMKHRGVKLARIASRPDGSLIIEGVDEVLEE